MRKQNMYSVHNEAHTREPREHNMAVKLTKITCVLDRTTSLALNKLKPVRLTWPYVLFGRMRCGTTAMAGTAGLDLCSCQIFVEVCVVAVALKVLSCNQILNALLDLLWVRLEVAHQLRRRLEH